GGCQERNSGGKVTWFSEISCWNILKHRFSNSLFTGAGAFRFALDQALKPTRLCKARKYVIYRNSPCCQLQGKGFRPAGHCPTNRIGYTKTWDGNLDRSRNNIDYTAIVALLHERHNCLHQYLITDQVLIKSSQKRIARSLYNAPCRRSACIIH